MDLLDSIGKFDFTILIRFLLLSLLLIWVFVTVWVWNDAKLRSESRLFRIISFILVLPLNLPGLIIYFIIRPQETLEQSYWADLEKRYLLYETADLTSCERCGFNLGPGFNLCPNCKLELKIKCSGCEVMIDKGWQFCPFCGEQVSKPVRDFTTPSSTTTTPNSSSGEKPGSTEFQKESLSRNRAEFYTRLGQVIINAAQKFKKRYNSMDIIPEKENGDLAKKSTTDK